MLLKHEITHSQFPLSLILWRKKDGNRVMQHFGLQIEREGLI